MRSLEAIFVVLAALKPILKSTRATSLKWDSKTAKGKAVIGFVDLVTSSAAMDGYAGKHGGEGNSELRSPHAAHDAAIAHYRREKANRCRRRWNSLF